MVKALKQILVTHFEYQYNAGKVSWPKGFDANQRRAHPQQQRSATGTTSDQNNAQNV